MTTSSITRPEPEVVTCGRCAEATPITQESRDKARASVVESERWRAQLIETYDYEESVFLCGTCAGDVEVERRDPCPTWCDSCRGYSFQAEGTSHEHTWTTDDGTIVAEVAMLVTRGENPAVSVAVELEKPVAEFSSIEQIRATEELAKDIANFLERHGLVIGDDNTVSREANR
ncbi:hypothetical protein [Pimelobacter simplex]|uniref:hypothetical protein n=1 Tax=Nocardioides simplex TaxID=2045 RepID=UPI001932D54B|nr:hypothetical protein [Pimelobacter simplex]